MLNKHLSENSLLLKDQFAYIKSQSTINALHTVVDTALSNINNGLLTGIVQLDLRKGFDTLNHKILLYKLEKYGIHDNCLAWFKSYLHNRSQLVCSNGISSSLSHLSIGEQFWDLHYLFFMLMILVIISVRLPPLDMLMTHL